MTRVTPEHRWAANPAQFATRIRLDDASGTFASQVVVEPGTRALVIDDGQFLGEVPAGSYTLESFADRLRFWRRKQATVILTRQQELPLSVDAHQLPTVENLLVSVNARLSVQIDDVGLFTRNLMGNRPTYDTEQFRRDILPLLQQALRETVGRNSIAQLQGEDARAKVDAQIQQLLTLALGRYGLRFGQLQRFEVHHGSYAEHRQRQGEQWLAQQAADARLQEIKHQERINDLDLLAENVAADRAEGGLALRLRQISLQRELLAAARDEQFDGLRHEDEVAEFLHQRRKEQLLQDERLAELKSDCQRRSDQQESERRQNLTILELKQKQELAELRADLEYAARVQAKRHEITLALMTDSEANRAWRAQLKQEHEEQLTGLKNRRELLDQEQEVQLAEVHQQLRVEQLERELRQARQEEELELRRRKAELEQELAQQANLSQLEKLRQMQALNHQAAQIELELAERRQRVELELAEAQQDRAADRELNRMQTLAGMSETALIATAAAENARLLAEVEKHRASQQTEVARAQIEQTGRLQSEADRYRDQLAAVEQDKANAVVAAYRVALETMQQHSSQAMAASQANSPVITQLASLANKSPTVVVCSSCRAENPAAHRHCSNCGSQL